MFDGNVAQKGQTEPSVVIRIDEIGKQLEELQHVISAVEERLKPVLRPMVGAPKDDDEIERKEPHSPLFEQLDRRTHNIYMLTRHVQNILSRLEV